MTIAKRLGLASASTIVCMLALGAQAKEPLTAGKFLHYSAQEQRSYILTSTVMAGLVAGQNRKSQTRCIDDWVGQHEGSGFQPILKTMRQYPAYHPSGVIIAVLQKACGSFRY